MIDLERQIHDYYEAITDPVDVDQLATGFPRRSRVRRGRGWVVAAASAVLVLLVVGGGVLLMRGSDGPVVDEPSPSTADLVTPTEPIRVESLEWSRVPNVDQRLEGIGDVIVGGPGLVAVGQAGFWVSPDGTTWSQVHPDQVGGPYVGDGSVTVGGPGFVAAGTDIADDWEEVSAAVWTSTDGVTWIRVLHDDEVFGSQSAIQSVTAGGPGLVAVGWDASDRLGVQRVAIWISGNGLVWSRLPLDEAVFPEGTLLHAVTAGGPGLVAVGVDEAGFNAAVWTSPDGYTWSRVPNDENVFGSGVTGDTVQAAWEVTAGGPGLVAIGEEEATMGAATHAAVWTSPDGFTWSRVPHDEAIFGFTEGGVRDGKVVMNSIATVGSGLVAVGWENVFIDASGEVGHDRAVVWTSIDGLVWSRLPHDEGVFGSANLENVVASGTDLVALGTASERPMVWIARPGG